jgi:hypothetical protein
LEREPSQKNAGHKTMKEYVNNILEADLIDAEIRVIDGWHP